MWHTSSNYAACTPHSADAWRVVCAFAWLADDAAGVCSIGYARRPLTHTQHLQQRRNHHGAGRVKNVALERRVDDRYLRSHSNGVSAQSLRCTPSEHRQYVLEAATTKVGGTAGQQ